MIEVVTFTCPTLCDEDCETWCHEAHVPRWKREHQPQDCPAAPGSNFTFAGGRLWPAAKTYTTVGAP